MALYIVDSNFFIQAHRATYPLDIALSFWKKVKFLAFSGKIISIDKVRKELFNKNDLLEKWCKNNLPKQFFKDSSKFTNEYSQISDWALSKSNHYMPNAIKEFLDAEEADAFLIAFTLADLDNRCIVTQEVSAPQKTSIIKIPDCCNDFGIKYRTTIEMFRDLNETF